MKVLVFTAAWCPACLIMKPRWNEVAAKAPWLETIHYDFDAAEAAVQQYAVSDKLPAFIFLDAEGKEIRRLVGEFSQDQLWEEIIEHKN